MPARGSIVATCPWNRFETTGRHGPCRRYRKHPDSFSESAAHNGREAPEDGESPRRVMPAVTPMIGFDPTQTFAAQEGCRMLRREGGLADFPKSAVTPGLLHQGSLRDAVFCLPQNWWNSLVLNFNWLS
jgi:hypothetical protein